MTAFMIPSSGSRERQRGSLSAEIVVLAPVVFLFVLAAVGLGRYESARQEVVDAARAGVQAASVVASPSAAPQAASDVVTPTLRDQSHMCADPTTLTDVSAFSAGGVVRVTVTCTVSMSDLLVPGLPGSVTVHVTESAPIDPFRVVQ